MDESYLSFSALVRTDPVAHSPQSPHQTPQPDPGLWNIESDWTLLFYFSPPSLVSLWLNVFYLSVGVTVGGVWGKGRRREGRGGGGGGVKGSVAQVVVMKGVFHSFTLPVFPLFSCLRHLIKRAWIVDVTLSVSPPPPHPLSLPPPLFLVSHPHILPSFPPRPIYLDSVLYLPATTGIRPPIHSLTMPLSDHWQEARGREIN